MLSLNDLVLDADPDLVCDAFVGVGGGVTAPLTCTLLAVVVPAPNVLALLRGGLSGGHDIILRGSGLESLLGGDDWRVKDVA